MEENTQLPKEVENEIKTKASFHSGHKPDEDSTPFRNGYYSGYVSGATTYAPWKTKYDELCERYKALDQAMFHLQQQLKDKTGARWVKANIAKVLEWAEKFYSENADQLLLDDNVWYISELEEDSEDVRNCREVSAEELADLYLLNHPDESEAPQWTPADIKPEHNVGVLVFIPGEDNHITSGMWDVSNEWVLLDEYRTPEEEVTHWMPLPSFPEGYSWNEIPADWVNTFKQIAKEELGKLNQSRADLIREANNRDLGGAGRDEAASLINWLNNEGWKPNDDGTWYNFITGLYNYTPDKVAELFKQQKD